MNIKKTIDRIFETVSNDILAGKYKLIEKGEYSSKLKYGQNIIEVWTANGESSCKIYGEVNGLSFPEFKPEVKKAAFIAGTVETEAFIKLQLREARKSKKKALEAYREKLSDVKSLKQKLSN